MMFVQVFLYILVVYQFW